MARKMTLFMSCVISPAKANTTILVLVLSNRIQYQ